MEYSGFLPNTYIRIEVGTLRVGGVGNGNEMSAFLFTSSPIPRHRQAFAAKIPELASVDFPDESPDIARTRGGL